MSTRFWVLPPMDGGLHCGDITAAQYSRLAQVLPLLNGRLHCGAVLFAVTYGRVPCSRRSAAGSIAQDVDRISGRCDACAPAVQRRAPLRRQGWHLKFPEIVLPPIIGGLHCGPIDRDRRARSRPRALAATMTCRPARSTAHAVTGSPGRCPGRQARLRAPRQPSTWPSRRRRTGSGIHARQVCASVTPGPTRSSPAKNNSISAREWLCQVAAVYSAASRLPSA